MHRVTRERRATLSVNSVLTIEVHAVPNDDQGTLAATNNDAGGGVGVGTSIYYLAKRSSPLTQSEIDELSAVADRYAVEAHIEEYMRTGEGYNWESFDLNFDTAPDVPSSKIVVIQGATRLPDNTDETMLVRLRHWCSSLTDLRRLLRTPNGASRSKTTSFNGIACGVRLIPSCSFAELVERLPRSVHVRGDVLMNHIRWRRSLDGD